MNATPAQIPLQPLDPEMRQAMLEELAELERSIRRTEREKSDSNKAFKEELDGFRDRVTKILYRLQEDENFIGEDRLRAMAQRLQDGGVTVTASFAREPGSDDDTGDDSTRQAPAGRRGRK